MKTGLNRRLFHILAVIFLTASMFVSSGPRTAQAQEADAQPENSYLIPIPLPDLYQTNLSPRMDRGEAERVTESLLAGEAGKIIDQLRKLSDRGLVSDYEILPDAPVIRVSLARENAEEVLRSLPGESKLLAEESDGLPACIQTSAEHFPELVMAASRKLNWRASETLASAQALAAGAPVIRVYFYQRPDYSYGMVEGNAAPRSEVQLRLLRGGKQVALDYTLADEGGYYYFYHDYYSCLGDYNWSLQPGDVVEITAGGLKSSTTVTPIRGWVNAETNTVAGTTGAKRAVMVDLVTIDRGAPCETITYVETGTADSAGNFAFNLSSDVDFDRSAYAMVYSMDAAGNSTYYYADTYLLRVHPYGGYFYIVLRPNTSFSLTLKRGAATLETISGSTDDYWGEAYGWFAVDVLPGDVATLTYSGGQRTYTVVDWPSISVNRTTGQVSGSATPGLMLVGEIYNDTYSVTPRCSYENDCRAQTIPANGAVSLNFGRLLNGEFLQLYSYTPEGEILYDGFFEPSLEAYPDYNEVAIAWWGTDYLVVTLKTSANAVKDSYTFDSGYWSSNFWINFSADMVPGDRIEVTDGYETRSMTVGNLASLRANFSSDHVTGTSTAGHLLVETRFSNSLPDEWGCAEKDHAGGAFDIASGGDIRAAGYSSVQLRGSDGHYTIGYGDAFDMMVAAEYGFAYGYTETAGTAVNWTHKRGSTVLDSGSVISEPDQYFNFGSDVDFAAGDVISVSTGDGTSASATIPALSAQLVPAERRAYGQAIANRPVSVNIFRGTPDYWFGISSQAWADSTANYSLHFRPDTWSIDCKPFDLNGACQNVLVMAYLANGVRVYTYPIMSPAAAPDVFESDDTWQTAKTYYGPQSHTLDVYYDEDWVQFTVSAADVAGGVPFHLITASTGLFMDLNLELYASSNLTTPIASAWGEYDPWDGTQPPKMVYVFSQAGTYYLRLHSLADDWDGGDCLSVYNLVILRDPLSLYLPRITR